MNSNLVGCSTGKTDGSVPLRLKFMAFAPCRVHAQISMERNHPRFFKEFASWEWLDQEGAGGKLPRCWLSSFSCHWRFSSSDAWMIIKDGPQKCAAQFPKWLGCVVANHESLSGSLITGGGALFAAWVA
jgi:hypothetical protein